MSIKIASNVEKLVRPLWEPKEENLSYRLERAIEVAKENLYGYSDEDIKFIWNVIKTVLFFDRDNSYAEEGIQHPPIDRLFYIAADINFYTGIYDEEVSPETICSVYALKTAEYAQTVEDPLSSSLICIDAWRALSFIDRAKHLQKKLSKRLKKKKGGEDNIAFAQDSNPKHQEFQRKLEIIRPEFNELSYEEKCTERFSVEEVANKIMESLSQKTEEIIDFHTVEAAVEQLRKVKMDTAKIKHGFVLHEIAWPEKNPDNRSKKNELFYGEVREFKKGTQAKLKEWAKERCEEIEFHESITQKHPLFK